MKTTISRRRLITASTQVSFGMAGTALTFANVAKADPASHPNPKDISIPRQVAESYWRAECDRDTDRVGQHYHSDAIFMPPGQYIVGWVNIKKWYEESFRKFPQAEARIAHEVRNGNEAALEWEAVLTDAQGKRYSLQGVNIVLVEDGKFRKLRGYFDPSVFS